MRILQAQQWGIPFGAAQQPFQEPFEQEGLDPPMYAWRMHAYRVCAHTQMIGAATSVKRRRREPDMAI